MKSVLDDRAIPCQHWWFMMNSSSRNTVVAVVGASTNPSKWGKKIYDELKSAGFKVYAVNPKYARIGDDKCYPGLKSLPEKPGLVLTVVPPKVTEQVVKQCKELGVNRVWMQPGSESEKAIKYCEANKINVVYNACFVVDGLKRSFDGKD